MPVPAPPLLFIDLAALQVLVGKLHPLVVHFPIALLTLAGLLELRGWIAGRPAGGEARACLWIGALGAVASAISGWIFAAGHDGGDTLFWHRWGGIAVSVLALGALLLSRRERPAAAFRPIVLLLAPAVGLVGHLGGELSWGEGYLRDAIVAVFETRTPEPAPAPEGMTEEELHFVEVVWPILRDSCVECHGEMKQKGDLRLDRREDALAAPSIVAGDAEASDLVFLLESDFEKERMPPPEEGPPLPAEEIAAIRRWIDAGAPWPAGELPAAPR
jgi:uncharacterized membrane protein